MSLRVHDFARVAVTCVAFGLGVACVPAATITATRSEYVITNPEPVSFVLYQSTTDPDEINTFKDHLYNEMKRRKIDGKVFIITGVELDEEQTLNSIGHQSHCVIMIRPVGGTLYYGSPIEVLYDVRVLGILGPDKIMPIWRGRVDTRGSANRRITGFTTEVIAKLISDGVLPQRVADPK
jgi:hypothetical protein